MFPASYIVDNTIVKLGNWISKWMELVEEYCDRSMTLETDKLVAISALAQEFGSSRDDRYLAGLWQSHLAQMLLWRALEPKGRPSMWRAPTWSWASVQGGVTFPIKDDQEAQVEIEIVQAAVVSAMPHELYGRVSSAFLIATGLLKEAPRLPPPTTYNERAWPTPELGLCDEHIRNGRTFSHCTVVYDTETAFEEANHPVPLYCLKVLTNVNNGMGYPETTVRGIVLTRKSSENPGPHDVYERVGYFEYRCGHCKADPFQGTLYQTVKII